MSSILTPENTQALLQLAGAVLSLLLSWLIVTIRQKTGVQIRVEQEIEVDRLRQRFAEAIYNGVLAILSKMPDADRDTQIDAIVGYMMEGVGETMEKLGVTDDVLRMRASGMLDEISRYRARDPALLPDGQTAARG
jgi:hypothetical protein